MTDDERARALDDSQRAAEVITYIRGASERTDLMPYMLAVFHEIRRDEWRRVWEEALAVVEQYILVPEDEAHDNQVEKQDGDGTSYNMGLKYVQRGIQKRLEEYRQQAEEEGHG